MTPEERSLLERTHKLAEENNDILRSMRRMNRISGAFRVLYWIVILGAGVSAFYFVQPYFESTLKLYDAAQSTLNEQMTAVKTISNTANDLKNLGSKILPK